MPAIDSLTPKKIAPSSSKLRIVLANASLAQYPQGGGHWSALLQYLFGLTALGHDVFWLELLQSSGSATRDRKLIRTFFSRFHQYGFTDRCALLLLDRDLHEATLESAEVHGMSLHRIEEAIRSTDLVWNFCCSLRQPLLALFKRRVLVDLDPGMIQVPALDSDLAIADHDTLLTVGSKLGDADCRVPTLDLHWERFLPFVYLPAWEAAPDPGADAAFSSVTQWSWEEIWYDGCVLSASKRQAFLRYVEMPQRTGRAFELAANIHPRDATGDRELMHGRGWRLVHPDRIASSPATYQDYIRRSRAEFCCAKPIYRDLNSGWFSDRSVAYLACGRPVLAEETGFSSSVPTGRGLLSFEHISEAVAGVHEIDENYRAHSRAARELAEAHFNSEKWLPSMLSACGW
ncbi:MAG TPA: hypothetical protein VMT22_02005 [Terriglobales bacterium]|jgi:hypothetical protein|nr:hypothetical protein [Terriglobales bacterium]